MVIQACRGIDVKRLTAPILAVFLFASCGGIPTGIQPDQNVVINAEKTLAISRATFETFLKLEGDNRALVKSKLPSVHAFAEYLRGNPCCRYINWLQTADHLKNDYKSGTVSLGDLQAALNVVISNATKATDSMTSIQNAKP
jgi:hypothetical protein